MNNPSSKDIISKGIRKRVGNGLGTLFWEDLWIGDSTLKSRFPRLFLLAPFHRTSVASMGFWNGPTWEWCFTWLRDLRMRDQIEENDLKRLIHGVHLSFSTPDEVIWAPDKNGSFSVKSVSTELAKTSSPVNLEATKLMWRGLVPPRIEIFVWLSCLGKLNTRAKLAKINVILAAEDSCPFCQSESETVDHILLHCKYSWKVWCWWQNLWKRYWVPPASLSQALIQWSFPNPNQFSKKVWWAGFFVIAWSLWKARNGIVFNSKQTSFEQICDLIMLRIGWWLKGWGDPFPYSTDDIIRNPSCLIDYAGNSLSSQSSK